MPNLTITLSEERYQALKETAARQHKNIEDLIDESLEFYGIKTGQSAAALVAQARQRSQLSEADALDLAVAETRSVRRIK